MSNQIFHIYHGTQGSAGLYTDQIYSALKSNGFSQRIFVSYYYPFNYGEKIFFKHTDLISGAKKTKLRLYLRYFELIKGLFITLCKVIKEKPAIINYSLINVYYPEIVFLKLARKFSKAKLIITCHDVIPFNSKHSDTRVADERRLKVFTMADYLLVHNSNSISDLIKYYNIKENSKILIHKFPILDLSKIINLNMDNTEKSIDFLFLGHLREEKGVNILLDAWKSFYTANQKSSLYIAGNLPEESDLSIEAYKDINITFDLGYLSDKKYCMLIKKAKYVVLPYLRGTNSGVASTVLALGTNIIASNIPMFNNNPLIDKNNLFESENIESLVQMLNYKKGDDCHSSIIEDKVNIYQSEFESEIVSIYKTLN